MAPVAEVVDFLQAAATAVGELPAWQVRGRLVRVVGLVMEATGLELPVGASCLVLLPDGQGIEAEVVGFADDRLFLMPAGDVYGLKPGAPVIPIDHSAGPLLVPGRGVMHRRRQLDAVKHMPVGDALLGRVMDATGRPLDGRPMPEHIARGPLISRPFNAMEREPVRQALDVGVRTINALLTVGRGQRMGLFAGSGVGKSVLLGMMAKYTSADVIVVGLIGERGREVKDFIENILGPEGLSRAVVVAAPADTSPLVRLHGASYATAIAEHFRDQGRHVLLLMDSLTRFAMAQREIALAVGEPPATKGYPPSAFARLPQLVERAGNGRPGGGSITAFYTVLTEGDDQQDPIADAARAILDGHIVLSRRLAESGHYPAIDIEASISRVFQDIAPPSQIEQARRFKQLYSRYERSRDLITVGAYAAGRDPELDEAVQLHRHLLEFLRQDLHEAWHFAASCAELAQLMATPG